MTSKDHAEIAPAAFPTAICIKCGLEWNISRYQTFPREGYICPYCTGQSKQKESLCIETKNRRDRAV